MSGSEIAAEIKAALEEVGVEVGSGPLIGTILRKGPNTGTSYSPVYGPDVPFDFVVVLGKFSNREREGTAILATDTKITCSVGDTVPVVSDEILIQGTTYKIYGVDPVRPLGVDLIHRIWARS